jgi:hypothetical protein
MANVAVGGTGYPITAYVSDILELPAQEKRRPAIRRRD